MSTDEINNLIRMAQVLKVRTGFLADELAKNKRGPEAGSARKASDLAREVEAKLSSILIKILSP